jgi:Flp pilus assembly pilin Flp
MRLPCWARRAGATEGETTHAAPVPETRTEEPAGQRGRRAATALEYLVCASFILVVLIVVVQHLGSIAGGLFRQSSTATSFKE